MKEALKLSLALGLICAVASGVLAFANVKTKDARERADNAERERALGLVLPAFDNQPLQDGVTVSADGGEVTFYRARHEGELVAVAGEGTTGKGFGGNIQVLAGMDAAGVFRAVVVTRHKETPGLGTQVTDRKEQRSLWSLFRGDGCAASACCPAPVEASSATLPPSAFLDQFHAGNTSHAEPFGAADAPFALDKDGGALVGITGATVSSRAVADAVTRISEAFERNKAAILASQ